MKETIYRNQKLPTTHYRTASGSLYWIARLDEGHYYFGAIEAPSAGKGARFVGEAYRIEEPSKVSVGDRLWVYAHPEQDDFPSSGRVLSTSRITEIKEYPRD